MAVTCNKLHAKIEKEDKTLGLILLQYGWCTLFSLHFLNLLCFSFEPSELLAS